MANDLEHLRLHTRALSEFVATERQLFGSVLGYVRQLDELAHKEHDSDPRPLLRAAHRKLRAFLRLGSPAGDSRVPTARQMAHEIDLALIRLEYAPLVSIFRWSKSGDRADGHPSAVTQTFNAPVGSVQIGNHNTAGVTQGAPTPQTVSDMLRGELKKFASPDLHEFCDELIDHVQEPLEQAAAEVRFRQLIEQLKKK